MNFYIDFEATQPGNEIISIGAVSGDGATFSCLVKPVASEITPFITELTGITVEKVKYGVSIDQAIDDLWSWMLRHESAIAAWNVYSYGNSDADFLKVSMKTTSTPGTLLRMSYLATILQDATTQINRYFNGRISLIHAYNYIQTQATAQAHDALEDAKMLQVVFDKTKDQTPLARHPYKIECGDGEELVITDTGLERPSFNKPKGVFYCSGSKSFKNIRTFADIDEAVTWVINTFVPEDARAGVHRDRISVKIMKALKSKNSYQDLYWKRDKNKTVEDI